MILDNKKRIIIFDFNGTLSSDVFWSTLTTENRDAIQEFLFKENDELVNEWMLGNFSSEDVCKILSHRIHIEYSIVYRSLVDSCNSMRIRPEIMRGIQKLRSYCLVFIVTNNMDCFSRFFVPHKKLRTKFDGIYNSADYGVFKQSDGGLFDILMKDNSSKYENSILVDDSIEVARFFTLRGGSVEIATSGVEYSRHIKNIFQPSLFLYS